MPFKVYHPINNMIYYVVVIVISMTFLSLPVLVITLLSTLFLTIQIQGRMIALKRIRFVGLIALVMMTFNVLFNHRGTHVLTHILGKPLTLEAILMGLVMALSLGSILLLFATFSEVIDQNKFLYLIGRILPRTGFLMNLTIHFTGLMTRRYQQIRFVRGLNAPEQITKKARIHEASEQLLTLVGWSAENAIVTADSMSARGYGAFKRTWFQQYGWYRRDWIFLVFSTLLLMLWVYFRVTGRLNMIIYPAIVLQDIDVLEIMLYGSLAVYLNIPLMLNRQTH